MAKEGEGAGGEGEGGGDGEIAKGSRGAQELKAAGQKYLESLSPEQRKSQLKLPPEITREIGDVEAEGEEEAERPAPRRKPKEKEPIRTIEGKFAKRKEPAAVDADEEGEEEEGEPARREEAAEAALTDEEVEQQAERLVELEEIPEADRTDEQAEELQQLRKDEPKETVITLRGLDERGEEDIELEIDDPAVVERIKRLQNDGLRRAEFNSRLDELEGRSGELAQAEAFIEANPIGFVIDHMTQERQLDVAKALIAQHFEALAPSIEEFFEKPDEVTKAQLKYERERNKNTEEVQKTIQARNAARQIERSVLDLIPEGTDRDTVAEFMEDAQSDLLRAISRKERVSPNTVALLLKKRIQMYGFCKAKEKDPAGARPITDRAKALAERTSQASTAQSRIKRTQLARRNARGIAPAGTGAAIVKESLVPKGATVQEATAALRKKGRLSGSWSDFSRGGS
jgi:DNA-binding Lrp family transcriptional regulator